MMLSISNHEEILDYVKEHTFDPENYEVFKDWFEENTKVAQARGLNSTNTLTLLYETTVNDTPCVMAKNKDNVSIDGNLLFCNLYELDSNGEAVDVLTGIYLERKGQFIIRLVTAEFLDNQ